MTSQSYDFILFDLDGTLIDSVPDVRRSLNRALAARGRAPLDLAAVKGLVGQGARVLVEKALDNGAAVDAAEADAVTRDFLDDYAANPVVETVAFPHAFEVLDRFREAGLKLGLCTNKPRITTTPVIQALGLESYFGAIVCGDEAVHRKPDGRHLLEVLAPLGGTADRAVMIGDSENDIDAARDAGIASIAVTFGYCHVPHEELGADLLITDLAGLPDAVDKLARMRAI